VNEKVVDGFKQKTAHSNCLIVQQAHKSLSEIALCLRLYGGTSIIQHSQDASLMSHSASAEKRMRDGEKERVRPTERNAHLISGE